MAGFRPQRTLIVVNFFIRKLKQIPQPASHFLTPFRGSATNLNGRMVYQLIGESMSQHAQDGFGVVPPVKQSDGFLQLCVADAFRLVAKAPQNRHRIKSAQMIHEIRGACRNQTLSFFSGAFSRLHVVFDDLTQIVDGIEIYVGEFADFFLYVPGNSDIHHKHGFMLASLERLLHRAFAKNRQRTGGGSDNDIRTVQIFRDVGKPYSAAMEFSGQISGPGERAIGDNQRTHPGAVQMTRHQLNRLAGANQQGGILLHIGENMRRHAYRRISNGDGVFSNRRLGPHPLRDSECMLKQAIQWAAQRTSGSAGSMRFFHLPKNLRLAQHHGINAAGDAHHVLRSIFIIIYIAAGFQLGEADLMVLPKPLYQAYFIRFSRGGAVQLRAIARGKDCDFVDVGAAAQALQRISQLFRAERHLLPDRNRGGFMINTYNKKRHNNQDISQAGDHFNALTAAYNDLS
ncbi:conserved hypothetical protein [Hahella chejuensis KCTC 2396]|uniref:Uncharacterized protein n=1 Tax=Hahella chejuensis (strain KCTC 2396) TaxID=349521 RepID=Q2SL97_HAHCH|nr:conserved hypothetical protein [Hahella chejuensis KCTC 2396]